MKKLTLNERIEFATLELKDQGINLSEYHQPAEIENELNSHDVPQEMSFDDWNSFIKKHNPEIKILTLDERFALLNGHIEKEMNEWHAQLDKVMLTEQRDYRYLSRIWLAPLTASDEQVHLILDRHYGSIVPRYTSEEYWEKAPKKFLDN